VSLAVSLASTALLLVLALPMAAALTRARRGWIDLVGLLGLATSPLVIGTGLFVILNPVADPFALALPVTAAVNALMALPFALRILVPASRETVNRHGRLALSLGMQGAPFARLVWLRRLRPQIGFAAGLGAALSMGDLGVIALFAAPDVATLPLEMYRLMGAYRMEAAAGAALLLLGLAMALFWLFDRGGRMHVEP
jgi:thiamine transport system permease protein